MLVRLRAAHRHIPSFALYGERTAVGHTDALHIEDIPSRSRKYLWKIATHRHHGLSQIIVLTAGPATATLEDSSFDCLAPTLFVLPAGTVHSFRFRADTDGYVLTVDLERLLVGAAATQQVSVQSLFAAPRAVNLTDDAPLARRVVRLMQALSAEFREPGSLNSPICSWLACAILTVAAEGSSVHTSPELWRSAELRQMRHFRELVEAHHLKHWPVQRYAEQLKLSETTLNRLCQRLDGTTAFNLIQQRLALEARRRLMYLASSIESISAELGFKDPAYFSRFFRRHSGMSPNEFRRRRSGG